MTTVIRVVSCLAVFVLLNVWSAVRAEPLSIDAIAKLPAIQDISLSRDGDYMVALIAPPDNPDAEKPSIAVWNVEDLGQPPNIVGADKDSEFISATALKAGKILVVVRKPWTGSLMGCGEGKLTGSTRTYLYKALVTDTEFSKFDDPFAAAIDRFRTGEATQKCLDIAGTASLRSLLPLDDENVLINRLDTLSFNTEVLKYNLKTGDSEIIHRDVQGVPQADLIDPETLQVLTKTDITVGDGKYYFERWILDEESGDYILQPALVATSQDRHEVNILGRDNASGKYYVSTDQFADKDEIYLYDAKNKAYDDAPLFSHPDFDASGIVLGQRPVDFNQLLGITYLGVTQEVEWLDGELASILNAYRNQLVGQTVSIVDYNADRSRIVLRASSAKNSPTYFLLKDKTQNSLIGSRRPWISADELGETRFVTYEARDGLEIPAFMTLPSGWRGGDPAPPAVVLPHGGPWARDSADWDDSGWPQFLATRGFAVLQPQYRGSTGWGRNLWIAGDAEWGQKMQDDKDDGVAWMVSQGYADPAHIAIYGYSYGGFAAFAAAVRKNGPYKCAIGGAGVSDLNRLGNSWSSNRLQRVMQGQTVKGMDPLRNADSASIPVLVFHGDRDVRVPLSHGERFYKAVRKKVPAKWVKIKDMPHSGPWQPEMTRKSLAAIEDFLFDECAMPSPQ